MACRVVRHHLHDVHGRVVRRDICLQFFQFVEERVEIGFYGALPEFVYALVRRDVVGRVFRGALRCRQRAFHEGCQTFFA